MGLPIDRSSSPGERLWYLEIQAAGRSPVELDSLVAQPLMLAFFKDRRAEAVAARSVDEQTMLFIRSPVHVDLTEVASEMLGSVSLPDGCEPPVFGPAGPEAPTVQILVDIDLDRTIGLGVEPLALVSALIGSPPVDDRLNPLQLLEALPISEGSAPLLLRDIASLRRSELSRPGWDWALRVDGTSLERVGSQIGSLAAGPSELRSPSDRPSVVIVLDLDAVSRIGLHRSDVFCVLRLALGRPQNLRSDLRIQARPLDPERLAALPISGPVGSAALGELVRFASSVQPDCVFRIAPELVSGFLAGSGEIPENLVRAGGRWISDLSDAERALLDWPRPGGDDSHFSDGLLQ